MEKKQKLSIELVPRKIWGVKNKPHMPKELWREIWRYTANRSGHCCSICNHNPRKHPLVVHQAWNFDRLTKVAKFLSFECICIDCHDVKHIGWASAEGRGDSAFLHLKTVNQWTDLEGSCCVTASWDLYNQYQEDKERKWTVDDTNFRNSVPYKNWLKSQSGAETKIKFGSLCLSRKDGYNIQPKPKFKAKVEVAPTTEKEELNNEENEIEIIKKFTENPNSMLAIGQRLFVAGLKRSSNIRSVVNIAHCVGKPLLRMMMKCCQIEFEEMISGAEDRLYYKAIIYFIIAYRRIGVISENLFLKDIIPPLLSSNLESKMEYCRLLLRYSNWSDKEKVNKSVVELPLTDLQKSELLEAIKNSGQDCIDDDDQEAAPLITFQYSGDYEKVDKFLSQTLPSEVTLSQASWIVFRMPSKEANQFSVDDLLNDWNNLRATNPKPTNQDAIDIARKHNCTFGKWLIHTQTKFIDTVWKQLVKRTALGLLGPLIKVSPRRKKKHIICVYTMNFLDEDDVMRVRQSLSDIGFKSPLGYKPDIYTYLGIYSGTVQGICPVLYSK